MHQQLHQVYPHPHAPSTKHLHLHLFHIMSPSLTTSSSIVTPRSGPRFMSCLLHFMTFDSINNRTCHRNAQSSFHPHMCTSTTVHFNTLGNSHHHTHHDPIPSQHPTARSFLTIHAHIHAPILSRLVHGRFLPPTTTHASHPHHHTRLHVFSPGSQLPVE